jgi:protein-tyrosine phosphatase
MADPKRILFVCQGNIVRSPLAEHLFTELAAERDLSSHFAVDSAGTISYHQGESPDARMRQTAAGHGYEYDGSARRFNHRDLQQADLVIAMDRENLRILRSAIETDQEAKLHLLREFDPAAGADVDVPDPYYGGQDGFETTFQIVYRSIVGLLDMLEHDSP